MTILRTWHYRIGSLQSSQSLPADLSGTVEGGVAGRGEALGMGTKIIRGRPAQRLHL